MNVLGGNKIKFHIDRVGVVSKVKFYTPTKKPSRTPPTMMPAHLVTLRVAPHDALEIELRSYPCMLFIFFLFRKLTVY
jgi:hypothetical protein